MTPEEENRLLKGPFPWRGPGFIVAMHGLEFDFPPSLNWKEKAWDNREERRKTMQEIREDVYEDTAHLSRSALQATIEMTREELALRWESVKRKGEELTEPYEEFRSWIAERLRDHYRENPKGAKWPRCDRVEELRPWNEVVRSGMPRLATQHFRVELRVPTPTTFLNELRTANTLLQRYRTLRFKRFGVALGSSNDDYTPSDGAQEILWAVSQLDQKREGLEELDYKSNIWRLVHRMIGEGELNDKALKRLNQRLRSDMEGKGVGDRFPETPEELVELAREHAPSEPPRSTTTL
jgi:hypothetical protein